MRGMIDNSVLRHLGGTVSQVMGATELVLKYFTQDGVPEKVIQQIEKIIDTLQRLALNLVSKFRQELDEQTIEALFQEGVTEWGRVFDELLLLIDDVMQTVPLAHIQEIEEIIELLKPFWEGKSRLIREI